MNRPTLFDLRDFLRVDDAAIDPALQLALDAAKAEAESFVGGTLADRWPDGGPSDVVMAVLVLAQTHADAGTPHEHEYRRAAAQSLLRPYRLSDGFA